MRGGVRYGCDLRPSIIRKEPRTVCAAIILDVRFDPGYYLLQSPEIRFKPSRAQQNILRPNSEKTVPFGTTVFESNRLRESKNDGLIGPCLVALKLLRYATQLICNLGRAGSTGRGERDEESMWEDTYFRGYQSVWSDSDAGNYPVPRSQKALPGFAGFVLPATQSPSPGRIGRPHPLERGW
jgi:hypothetical protein